MLLVWVAFSAGCGKKQLTPAEIRAITRELVFAAKNATGDKVEIGMRPESLLREAGNAAVRPGNRGTGQLVLDHIYITLRVGRAGGADPAALQALEAALDEVASRHGLSRDPRPGAPGLVRFDYRPATGGRTHAIHIITPLVSRRPEASGPTARPPVGRLAIIIDDLGYDRAAADALFALPVPLTVSVLPHLAHSADIAEEAYRRGYQVMLHLPMESSNGGGKPEALELRAGMGPDEITRLLAGMLETVPHAVGVNNHQGSLATTDAQLMDAIMPTLRERELFFIDSRTTAATVAYDTARRTGVRAASRNVFLDAAPSAPGAAPTLESVWQQLARAARQARRHGFAIAIGHPHPATVQALEEYLPQLEAHGIGLVFASDLVR